MSHGLLPIVDISVGKHAPGLRDKKAGLAAGHHILIAMDYPFRQFEASTIKLQLASL